MYLYYDRAGNLREIINDSNRQRNVNYNEIYVYVEPSADQPQPEDGVYKLPAQWNTANAAFTRNAVDLVGSLTSMSKITIDEIPYNKERDLKYFKYFAKYQVFKCTIPSSVYASAGIVTATVQLADTVDNVEDTLTAFSFNVEATTGVVPDSTMTVAQYDYLFNLVNHMNDVVLENIAIIDRTDAATFNALATGRVFYDTHDNLYYIKTDTSPYYLEYDQGLLANGRTILRFAGLDEQYQLTEIHSMTDGRLSVIEVDGVEYLITMSSNAHIVAYDLFHKCWYEYNGVSSYYIGYVFQDEYKKDIASKQYVQEILENFGNLFTYKGAASVSEINALTNVGNGWAYNLTDSGTLTLGNLSVEIGDNVAFDGTAWTKLSSETVLGQYYTKQEGQAFEQDVNNQIDAIENQVQQVASGSPKGVYATLAALQAAFPTGTTGIYVVQADGHWYYWSGSAWADGGTYISAPNVVYKVNNEFKDYLGNTILVKPMNIEGVVLGNLKPYLIPYGDGVHYYYFNNNGTVDRGDISATFNNYLLKVDSNTTYVFGGGSGGIRFLTRLKDDLTPYDTQNITYATSVDTLGASYLLLSWNEETIPFNDFVVSKNYLHTDIELPEWLDQPLKKGEVKPLNIEGVELNNLFELAEQYGNDNYYYFNDNGTIASGQITGYKAYIIPVEQNKNICMTFGRFVVLLNENKQPINTTNYTNVTEINTLTAKYILISFNTTDYDVERYFVSLGCVLDKGYKKANWMKEEHPSGFSTKTDTLVADTIFKMSPDGTSVGVIRSVLKEYNVVSAHFDITSLSSFEIGFRYNDLDAGKRDYFVINNSTIQYYNYGVLQNTFTHTLTFSNNIQFLLTCLGNEEYKLTLVSNGEKYETTINSFSISRNCYLYLKVSNEVTNVRLSFANKNLIKDIALFGDSYIGITNNERWCYYLKQYGYNNVLLNGFAGEGSTEAKDNLISLFNVKKPKTIIWCMGMNDGSDTDDTTPSSTWLSVVQFVMRQCDYYGIELILATIPNVPTVNNKGKNYFVRNSGYRYIDFAKAVGSDNNTSWYSGMLSSDNVHPNQKGALALFMEAIADVPELCLGEPYNN